MNTSPAAGAPLTSTSSRPSPPFMTSVASPLFHPSMSSPRRRSSCRCHGRRRSGRRRRRRSGRRCPRRRGSGPARRAGDRVRAGAAVDREQRECAHAGVRRDRVVPPSPLTSKRSVAVSSVRAPVRRWNLTRPAFGSSVFTSPRRGVAVDLGAVVAGVAVDGVRTVAVVPHQCVVARAAAHGVGAARSDDAVVAVAAAEQVVAVGAGETRPPASPRASRRQSPWSSRAPSARRCRPHTVDDDGERAVGRGLVAGRAAVPVRAAVEPTGRLAVHEQAAGHRHRDVVIRAIEVERRRLPGDRRRGDRRAGG